MRSRSLSFVVAGIIAGLMFPSAAGADHVDIAPSVSGSLVELRPSSATVEVGWSATCSGPAAGDASYQGNLYLHDVDTGEDAYLGGVFSAAGSTRQIVQRRDEDRRLQPLLQMSCFDDDTLHGSSTKEVGGGLIVVPARGSGGGGGDGGGGGGGHGGGDGGDPTDPLGPGGCSAELLGTPRDDRLDGGARGDLIRALQGDDRLRGRAGGDCLIGGSGSDRLLGADGPDRLTGGGGSDLLEGGGARNAYDAGPGADRVEARNGSRELVRCGTGADVAKVDRRDRTRGCERVLHPR